MDQVGAVLDEAINEAIGLSRKKWALVLVALAVGAIGACWLLRRDRSVPAEVSPAAVPTT